MTTKDYRLTIAGVSFEIGEECYTPDGEGVIVDIDRRNLRIGVRLESCEIRWYSWIDVSF